MATTSSSIAFAESRPAPLALQGWLDWVERRCGLCITATRLHVLESSLRERLAAAAVSPERYFQRVAVHGDEREATALVERLLNHETTFFRHLPSYEALESQALPRIAAPARAAGGSGALSLWSAGCSTGEEPFSMAAAALNALGSGPVDFHVIGTDWSEPTLVQAQRARWPERQLSDIPEPHRGRYFRRVRGPGASFEPHPALRARVRFEQFNFLDPATYPAGAFHVIFCQNVLIYFRERLRADVVANLAARLKPGGYLFTGPGEMAMQPLPGLEPVRFGPTVVFRRRDGRAAMAG